MNPKSPSVISRTATWQECFFKPLPTWCRAQGFCLFRRRKYIDLTCDLLRIESRDFLVFENRADEDTYDRIACADRIHRQLGWTPQVTLRQLCREMIRCSRQ